MLLPDRPAEKIVEEGMSDDEELDGEENVVVADEQPERRSSHRSTAATAGKSARSGKGVKQQEKGVVYISRIPPHLKPQKMRQMLEVHGEVGRLYLAPEMASLRAKRRKFKGNTGKNFTEGWVEFEDKRVAKSVAKILNGQQMGGKRRSAYHYDLWCLKYLPKFKWEALTEELAYQRAVHDQRLAHEISTAKRERDFYLSRMDKSKGMAAIKERKQQQAAAAPATDGSPSALASAPATGTSAAEAAPKRLRGFGQRQPKMEAGSGGTAPISDHLLRLIAGKAPA